jgi:hypothetical protein
MKASHAAPHAATKSLCDRPAICEKHGALSVCGQLNGQLICTNESLRRRTTFETADIVFPASNYGPSGAPTGNAASRSGSRQGFSYE